MAKRRRKRKVRRLAPTTVLAIFIILFAAVVLVTVILLIPKNNNIMEQSASQFSLDTDAVLVRDEESYSAEFALSRINFTIREGSDITEGQELGVVYKQGYTDDVAQRLNNVRKDIYALQLSLLKGINNPELDTVEQEIDRLTDELCYGSERLIVDIEADLNDALSRRSDMLRQMVQPTEELTQLYSDEETYKKQLDEWTCRIVSAKSGRMSCYFDGFEQALSTKKTDTLTVSLIERVMKSDGYSTAVNSENLMYRLVDADDFCIALITDASKPVRLHSGEKYTVVFEGYESTPYEGECIRSEISGNKALSVVKISGDMGNLITVRSASCKISGTFDGLKVKSESVKTENGKAYVQVVDGKNTKKVFIDVLAMDEEYAIIRGSGDSTLAAGTMYK